MITWGRIEIIGAWPKGQEAPPVGVVSSYGPRGRGVWPAVQPLPLPSSWNAFVVLTTELVPGGPSCLHSLRALHDCVQFFLSEGS